jgi:adenylyltransferase/sulfurtransferase
MSPQVKAGAGLDERELQRYSRHLVLPEVGAEGQERLKAARVLLVGAGGLGSPLGLYLAAAGVGTLGVVDFDSVDETNLQRQVLYGESDLGRPKVEAAIERLRDVNPLIRLEPHGQRLDSSNALQIASDYDLIADGSDNFSTRYLVNDLSVLSRRPNVYGSIFRFEGQVSVFGLPGGPCYRCLFPEPPPPGLVPSCAEGGVLGVLPGIVGALQANEVIKLILGVGDPLKGRLLLIDCLAAGFRELELPRDPHCPVCGDNPTITRLVDYEEVCAPPLEEISSPDLNVSPRQVSKWLDEGREFTLLDVRTPVEVAICRLPGSIFVPLQELPERLTEIAPDRRIVVYCHHGIRSAQAVAFLRGKGFQKASNLTGGIEAWRREVDSSMPRY